jgi:hypothetical protein
MVSEAASQHLQVPQVCSVALDSNSGFAPFDSNIVGDSVVRVMDVGLDLGFEAGEEVA